MAVTVTDVLAGPFTPNGVTVAFPFEFKIPSTTEVRVFSVLDNVVTAFDPGLYLVTLAGDGEGGTVTFTAPPAAALGSLYIEPDPLFTQPAQFNNNAFLPATLNPNLDRAAVRDLWLKRRVDVLADSAMLHAPARIGRFLAWDADGEPFPSAGTGTDSGLRTDLAASNGAALAGFLQADTDAVALTVQDKNSLSLDLHDFIPKSLWPATRAATSGATFNASPYIQKAIDAAVARGAAVVNFRSGQFRCNTGVNWYPEKVSLIGEAAHLDCRGLTGDFITAVPLSADRNLRAGLSTVNCIRGFTVAGPSGDLGTFLKVQDVGGGVDNLAGVSVENCFLHDWGTDFDLGDGAFWFRASNGTSMSLVAPVPTNYSVNIRNANNSGERIQFDHWNWSNRHLILRQDTGNASTFLSQCSLVYSDLNFVLVNGGLVSLSQCHIEGDFDTAHWFAVYGADALLVVDNCVLANGGPMATYSPFYSDSTSTNGGVVIRNLKLVAGSTWAVPLIGGTGRTDLKGVVPLRNGARPILSASSNLLAYGDFENANALSEWSISSGTYVKRSSMFGTNVLEIEGNVSGVQSAEFSYRAEPGQNFFGQLYYRTASLAGNGGTFFIQVAFLDKGGNALVSNSVLATTADVGAWTKLDLTLIEPAPAGTVSCRIYSSIFNTPSGAPKAYIDGVIAGLA